MLQAARRCHPDQNGILSRWAEHLSELLNCINPIDSTFIDLKPQLPIIPNLDQLPTFHEFCEKSAASDGLPDEVLKYCDFHIINIGLFVKRHRQNYSSSSPFHQQRMHGLRVCTTAMGGCQNRDRLQAIRR